MESSEPFFLLLLLNSSFFSEQNWFWRFFILRASPPSLPVPLCPLLNLSSPPFSVSSFCFQTIVWAAVSLLSLPVFLALFHQPVVHQPIFHPAFVSCLGFIFLLSIFLALVFLIPYPVWQLHPPPLLFFFVFEEMSSSLMQLRRCRGHPVGPRCHDCLDCLLSSVSVLTDHLRPPESQKGNKTGQRSHKGHKVGLPFGFFQTVDWVVTSFGSHLISCGHKTCLYLWPLKILNTAVKKTWPQRRCKVEWNKTSGPTLPPPFCCDLGSSSSCTNLLFAVLKRNDRNLKNKGYKHKIRLSVWINVQKGVWHI